MVGQSSRFVRLSRVVMVIGLLLGTVVAYGQIALGQGTPNGTGGPSVIGMTWPNGVDLLAGHELDLAAGDYEWRISTLNALALPGEPIETGSGVVVAVSGPVLVQLNNEEIVRLGSGAALTVREDDSLVVVSVGEEPEEFLLVELAEVSDNAARDDAEVVGPLAVQGGRHALVLLNVPVAVTIDVTLDEIIQGSLRPAVSIAHTGNEIPDDLSTSRNYDRWIVALFPPNGAPATNEPTSAPSMTPSPSTPAPSTPGTPTATATSTATATMTATATATVEATSTATATATATTSATNTPTATPTDTPVPATNTPTATPTDTPVPPTNTPTATPTDTPPA